MFFLFWTNKLFVEIKFLFSDSILSLYLEYLLIPIFYIVSSELRVSFGVKRRRDKAFTTYFYTSTTWCGSMESCKSGWGLIFMSLPLSTHFKTLQKTLKCLSHPSNPMFCYRPQSVQGLTLYFLKCSVFALSGSLHIYEKQWSAYLWYWLYLVRSSWGKFLSRIVIYVLLLHSSIILLHDKETRCTMSKQATWTHIIVLGGINQSIWDKL